jgi:hypothetical protein
MEYQGSWDKNLPWAEFSYNNSSEVAVWWWPKRREGSMGWLGWKERRAVARLNPEPGQNSKEILFKFQLIFRIWQNFGNLHKEI